MWKQPRRWRKTEYKSLKPKVPIRKGLGCKKKARKSFQRHSSCMCFRMHHPGIEPRAQRWQRWILPLNQWCGLHDSLYTLLGQKIAPSGNRTQGSTMATLNFTTKPMVPNCLLLNMLSAANTNSVFVILERTSIVSSNDKKNEKVISTLLVKWYLQ